MWTQCNDSVNTESASSQFNELESAENRRQKLESSRIFVCLMVINEDPEWEAERSWQPCLSCLHESIKLTVGGIQNWRRRWWSPMAVVEARMHTRTAAAEYFQNMKNNYRLKEESLTLFALTHEHNWHALQLSPVAAVPAHTAAFGTPRTKKRTHWSVVVVERTLVSRRVFPRQSGQRACPCVRGLHHTHSPGSAKISFLRSSAAQTGAVMSLQQLRDERWVL